MATIECMLKWVCLMLISTKWVSAYSRNNREVDALMALKQSLSDPNGALDSWDANLVDTCTYFHVTCDAQNRLTRLDLGNYNLSGKLVPDLAELEHLQYLELYKNNIQGSIPPELGNLRNLIALDLYNNNLSGTIPAELGKTKSLIFLRLNNNKLTGPIPIELTNLSNLRILDVSSNDLSGKVPTTGPFVNFPPDSFKNNPRLKGPSLLGRV